MAPLPLLLALLAGDPLDELVAASGALFDADAAFETVAFADGFFRVRGNEGYNRVLDHVGGKLREAGFRAEGFFRVYEFTDGRSASTWTPRAARLELLEPEAAVLHAFQSPEDAERVTLCIHSRPTPPEGVVAEVVDFDPIAESERPARDLEGKIVLTDGAPGPVFRRAAERGAVGVLSASIEAYNRPDRHPDAIQFGSLGFDEARRGFGFKISRRSRDRIRALLAGGRPVVVRATVQAELGSGSLRTLVAEVRGVDRPDEMIAFAAHVQEPGANDNASGVGVALEIARAWKRGIEAGTLPRPVRTTAFIWGEEIESTALFVGRAKTSARTIVAGVALDMVGERTEVTGGAFRIERPPDPGAVWLRPPDAHTEWGSTRVRAEGLRGHYLADLLRTVCDARARSDGWVVEENPFEGGSDHQPFLDAGVPAALLWHFPDFAYHTSLDRLDKVDVAELERVGASALAASAVLTACVDGTIVARVRETFEARATARLRSLADGAVRLSRDAGVEGRGAVVEEESRVVRAWERWYLDASARMRAEALACPGKAEVRPGRADPYVELESRLEAASREAVERIRGDSPRDGTGREPSPRARRP